MPLCLERFLASRTVIDFLESKLANHSVSRFDFYYSNKRHTFLDSP